MRKKLFALESGIFPGPRPSLRDITAPYFMQIKQTRHSMLISNTNIRVALTDFSLSARKQRNVTYLKCFASFAYKVKY